MELKKNIFYDDIICVLKPFRKFIINKLLGIEEFS